MDEETKVDVAVEAPAEEVDAPAEEVSTPADEVKAE